NVDCALPARKIGELLPEFFCTNPWQAQRPVHPVCTEALRHDGGVEGDEPGLNSRHITKTTVTLQFDLIHKFYFWRQAQTLCGGASVRTHEASRTQLDAAKPAHHEYRHLVTVLSFYGLQY